MRAERVVERQGVIDDLEPESSAEAAPPGRRRRLPSVESECRVQPGHVLGRSTASELRTRETYDLDLVHAELCCDALDARARCGFVVAVALLAVHQEDAHARAADHVPRLRPRVHRPTRGWHSFLSRNRGIDQCVRLVDDRDCERVVRTTARLRLAEALEVVPPVRNGGRSPARSLRLDPDRRESGVVAVCSNDDPPRSALAGRPLEQLLPVRPLGAGSRGQDHVPIDRFVGCDDRPEMSGDDRLSRPWRTFDDHHAFSAPLLLGARLRRSEHALDLLHALLEPGTLLVEKNERAHARVGDRFRDLAHEPTILAVGAKLEAMREIGIGANKLRREVSGEAIRHVRVTSREHGIVGDERTVRVSRVRIRRRCEREENAARYPSSVFLHRAVETTAVFDVPADLIRGVRDLAVRMQDEPLAYARPIAGGIPVLELDDHRRRLLFVASE